MTAQTSEAITGYALPTARACALAERSGWRQRALAYITRSPYELLVFEHPPQDPDAGTQVPAGGLEPGETPEQGAEREVFEEAGLRLSGAELLGSYHWTRAGISQVWHYCWLRAPLGTPDTWTHTVSAGQGDRGLVFTHRFVSLDRPGLVPHFRSEEALPRLRDRLRQGDK